MLDIKLDRKSYPDLEGLGQYIEDCERAIHRVKYEFEYPKTLDQCWNVENFDDEFISKFERMKDRGNVYAIFRYRRGCEREIVYIGTSKKGKLGNRIKQHLVTKSDSTNSKLEYIKSSVRYGFKIAVSYILVEPNNLRSFVEKELIRKLDPPWNKQGG